MSLKSLIILTFIVIAGGIAYYFTALESEKGVSVEDAQLIPDLAQNLGLVTKLTLHRAGNQLLAEVRKSEDGWVVSNRHDYEADISAVRGIFSEMAQARLIEKKTANQENYSRIGVEDISNADAQGVQFTITGLPETVRVITGKKGNLQDTQFIRKAGDAQSWLIDRRLHLDRDAAWWLRKDILDIPPEDIESIRIRHMDGDELVIVNVSRENYEFALDHPVSDDMQVSESELYQVANALSSLQLRNVVSLQSIREEILPSTIATFRTYDGLHVEARTFSIGKNRYVRLNLEIEPESAEENQQASAAQARRLVEALEPKVSGWAFELPTITQDAMVKRLEDILLQKDG